MTIEIQPNPHSLYETNYLRWIETTVEKLRQKNYAAAQALAGFFP